ncbi:hypothetical protein GPX89_04730 [Nocardia sp. ET3-3]|uniref:Uncharacterized protein n=1 Tax=Nocardia terrae TaxID=2675851 RepID=A0A7K1UQG5_9NOCA|nr:hypothetical protein [Nocardia terrae]MVU76547.1 hypothetical protein [Nocardia terrae]
MGIIDSGVCLSSFQVHWSPQDAEFIARSDRYPGLVARNEWSSLAAVDELIELIEQQGRQPHSAGRPAA